MHSAALHIFFLICQNCFECTCFRSIYNGFLNCSKIFSTDTDNDIVISKIPTFVQQCILSFRPKLSIFPLSSRFVGWVSIFMISAKSWVFCRISPDWEPFCYSMAFDAIVIVWSKNPFFHFEEKKRMSSNAAGSNIE